MTADDFKKSLAKLQAAVKNDGSVRAIEVALSIVVASGDPSYVRPVLLLLDDGAEFDEGMFSLIHAAEAFDDENYIHELLMVMPEMTNIAPKWSSIVLIRVLNSQRSRDALIRELRKASSPVKKAIEWLCNKINDKNPIFLSKTVPVLVAVQEAKDRR